MAVTHDYIALEDFKSIWRQLGEGLEGGEQGLDDGEGRPEVGVVEGSMQSGRNPPVLAGIVSDHHGGCAVTASQKHARTVLLTDEYFGLDNPAATSAWVRSIEALSA